MNERAGRLASGWSSDESAGMKLEELKLKLTAVFEPAPEGGYTCHFEELPQVFSEGNSMREARANLLDALVQVMDFGRRA